MVKSKKTLFATISITFLLLLMITDRRYMPASTTFLQQFSTFERIKENIEKFYLEDVVNLISNNTNVTNSLNETTNSFMTTTIANQLTTIPPAIGPFLYSENPNSTVNINIIHVPINISQICDQINKQLLVIIVSRFDEYLMRKLIRKTWIKDRPDRVSILFAIGVNDEYFHHSIHNSTRLLLTKNMTQLYDEIYDNDDIFIVDVLENYYNLTLKTYAIFEFTKQYCPQMKCIIKCDSDSVLNLKKLLKLCNQSKPNVIQGYCIEGRPIRDQKSKWFVPEFVYKSNTYPKFCTGTGYMLVGENLDRRLIENLNQTQFFISENFRKMGEDVVFSGLVAERANIQRISMGGFSNGQWLSFHCFADEHRKYPLIVHYVNNQERIDHFMKRMNNGLRC